MINLSNKERMLLEDEKEQEQLCIDKYTEYSTTAHDPELQNLFSQLAQKEQQHLDTINQLLNGIMPNMNSGQGQQQQQQSNMQNSINLNIQNGIQPQFMQQPNLNIGISSYDKHDKMLCLDSLSGEKFVSSTYNTTIFEFRDKNIRQILNHIQKEEQEHGEKIYNYMASHGMYQVQ